MPGDESLRDSDKDGQEMAASDEQYSRCLVSSGGGFVIRLRQKS